MQDNQQKFDKDQVDWYEVDEGGERTITFKDRISEKSDLIKKVVISFILIIIAVILAFLLVKFVISSFNDESVDGDIRLYIEACQTADDIEKCIASIAPRLAQQTGNIEYCEELNDDEYDSCIVLATLTSLEINNCKKIENVQKKNDCNDAVVSKSLDQNYLYEDCEKYIDSDRRDRCQQSWMYNAILSGNCDDSNISSELCSESLLLSQAIEARDPSICNEINLQDVYETCVEIVGAGDKDFDGLDADEEKYRGTSDESTDSDGDGLTDYEEVFKYETDPSNSDTDGDGYSDGEEIIGGYDPLR